jgi:alpha-tubulin suppressor-like RCC1 family protein
VAAAGLSHSLALDDFGNVWAWGNNDLGQLGSELSGGATGSSVPSGITHYSLR